MRFLLVTLLALCAHSGAAPTGGNFADLASDVLEHHSTGSGNGSPFVTYHFHHNDHKATHLAPAQDVHHASPIGYTNSALFRHQASASLGVTPEHPWKSIFDPSPSQYPIVLPSIRASSDIYTTDDIGGAALRGYDLKQSENTHGNTERGEGRGNGKRPVLDNSLSEFDGGINHPYHGIIRAPNFLHDGRWLPSVVQGVGTSTFVHHIDHHAGEEGIPYNVWYTTPSQFQHPISGQYFHPTKTTDVHDEEGRRRRAATSRFNNDPQQAWKAPLDGFVMVANRRYQKLANVKETTARKHLNEVKNPELVGLLLEDDKDVVKSAAHIIKTLDVRTQAQKGRGMASILLGDKLAGVCQELKQRGNTSLSTATRKVNNCMSIELACLLRNPDTREQGMQQLLAYHQSEATTSKSQRYV